MVDFIGFGCVTSRVVWRTSSDSAVWLRESNGGLHRIRLCEFRSQMADFIGLGCVTSGVKWRTSSDSAVWLQETNDGLYRIRICAFGSRMTDFIEFGFGSEDCFLIWISFIRYVSFFYCSILIIRKLLSTGSSSGKIMPNWEGPCEVIGVLYGWFDFTNLYSLSIISKSK